MLFGVMSESVLISLESVVDSYRCRLYLLAAGQDPARERGIKMARDLFLDDEDDMPEVNVDEETYEIAGEEWDSDEPDLDLRNIGISVGQMEFDWR